jgi:NAD(P)-dependent dehydrogenase (short-subunit alcohol dehydrogenase family)
MTKAGLISLTQSFANEYGHQGIRVNAILPGIVDTLFAKTLIDNPLIQKLLKRIPAGRAGKTDEMVAGVLYLVSDGASYTTGTNLVMDGGTSIS